MITRDIEYNQSTVRKDISVFPMSIPMLAGPGSLTLSILLFSNAQANTDHPIGAQLSVLAAILTISSITLVLMLLSQFVKRVIGRTGDEILRRFLGVILAALAIQFIADGVAGMGF